MMAGVGGGYGPAASSAVEDFLAAARRQPVGMLIEGEAGIGKTTLWAGVLQRAAEAGFVVLSARTGESESGLAHAAVADLLSAVDRDVLAALPAMQRLAADRVLLREHTSGCQTDERVTAAALLSTVQVLGAQAPVLVALDDVQWLDPSSRAVLAFVARRLRGPVGVVVTERTGAAQVGEPAASWLQVGTGGLTRVQVTPMSLGALHAMLSARLGRRFPRPAIVRIAEVSGGNPLYALELARVMDGDSWGPAMRLPSTLAELVRLRVDRLEGPVRDVLLAAASASVPTVDLIAEAVELSADRVTTLLEAAEVEGVVVIEGNRIRFTHPLLANGIYDSAPPGRRRDLHRRLADLTQQPERRARHLAMAATVADDATLASLDAAADSARHRGAPAVAAEFMELAIRLGGDSVSRRIRAAEHHYGAGDMPRAATLLCGVIGELEAGVLRAVALNLLAGVRISEDDYGAAVALLERARVDAEGHDAVHVSALLMLGFVQGMTGAFDRQIASVDSAVEVAERTGAPALISQALATSVYVRCQAGGGLDEAALQRAVDLEDADDGGIAIPFRASATRGIVLAITGRLDEADRQLTDVAVQCVQRGAEHDVMAVTGYRTLVSIWRGRFAEADRHAADLLERAQQLGGSMVLAASICAVAAAYRGRETEARELAQSAIERGAGYPALTVWARAALSFLHVSLGDHSRAAEAAEPLIELYRPFAGTELIGCWFVADTVEALIALGRHDEAEPMIDAFERNGAKLDRAWLLAIGNRCRAMLSAAGDLDGALEAVERAMVQHERLPMPFERARTQLVMGGIQRSLRRGEVAAETVRAAVTQFELLGTPLWAERARSELARIDVGERAGGAELTDSERRIAELVASGMSNKEVADTLYVSVKTVETNLTRVYRKLGIRSRSQLGVRLT